jgi:hypothetical protein
MLHRVLLLHVRVGVGSLVGAWLAAVPGVDVCLMGRTGRAPASPQPFLPLACAAGSAAVTMCRCDVAQSEEVTCALGSQGAHPHLSIIHAGMSQTVCIIPEPNYTFWKCRLSITIN